MKRHCFTIAILTALILSACSVMNKEPVESTGEPSATEAVTEPIRIESEKKSEASSEAMESDSDSSAMSSSGEDAATAAENVPAETGAVAAYAVTALQKTMYVTQPVHVRASYTTKSDVLTSLGTNQKVEVTGRSANGWIRIVYNGKDAYVYQKYLSESKTVSLNGSNGKKESGTSETTENPAVKNPDGSVGNQANGNETGGNVAVETPAGGPGAGPAGSGGTPASGAPSQNQNTEQIQTIPAAPIGGMVETLVPGEVSGPGVSPAGAVPGAAPGM